ncbi:Vi polysaccharide biosynthesis protein VipA/TviB [Helicobacter monodelphidis]|uniref:nucleotide sugar dehydrogenase n=1 Tax=Helicobacter sp. 15-1451 TaxID=2004995 RepID=UPI000DCC3CD9|nr:nucleotide sugar dehydrogenase [Helicobacter sp. 15-1451]RAX57139.1 Vi polysaccharide biosynthesis protein VipA/TviB [Helicobacter sp. 15-1451]
MSKKEIAVVGLGYVGLPLAVEFGKHYPTKGFDIKTERIEELKKGIDSTLECSTEELKHATQLTFVTSLEEIKNAQIYIVTVPTPIDRYNKPDLRPILSASKSIAQVLKKGDIVIYESTVYPGCTEDDCVPILEQSGLKYNVDFFCGYSPERINPGDKQHRLPSIKKVVSGSTPKIAEEINALYSSIITAGTYLADSIKVAEAAKVIENSQRDINIAFVNELSLIFERLGIDTLSVLEAAGSKWNFLPFRPGLVGGHCIGVDPYYLTHKAESLGYHSQVILAGRHINDSMASKVASKAVKLMIKQGHKIQSAKVAILGVTFKENCPDIRNSKVFDVVNELEEFGCQVNLFDTWADSKEVYREYQKTLEPFEQFSVKDYDCILLAVGHQEFKNLDFRDRKGILYDIKGLFPQSMSDARL